MNGGQQQVRAGPLAGTRRDHRLPLIPPASLRSQLSSASSASARLYRPASYQSARGELATSNQQNVGQRNIINRELSADQLKGSTGARVPLAPRLPLPKKPTEQQNINNAMGGEIWTSVEDLFWDHMKEVQNKWSTLKMNDDIWGKLIYFEQNRRLAKAYVSAPVLTIDGSGYGLDGFRIGLGGIDNNYRGLESVRCLRSIGQGVKLKIDSQGDVLVRKIGSSRSSNGEPENDSSGLSNTSSTRCSVLVGDWPSATTPSASSSSSSASSNSSYGRTGSLPQANGHGSLREVNKPDTSYKLFDMRKFRFQLEKQRLNAERPIDWRQCVSIISFVRNKPSFDNLRPYSTGQSANDILDNPCWLMLINIIAIDMLKIALCDDETIGERRRSSNMVRNHALLAPVAMGDRDKYPRARTGARSNPRLPEQPPKSSSSGSILPRDSMKLSFEEELEDEIDGIQMSQHPSEVAEFPTTESHYGTNENKRPTGRFERRIPKSGGQLRKGLSLNMRDELNVQSRMYQSTNQLSSSSTNNTIYTTFNSKYLNSNKYQADQSTTSGYNSTTQSSSSGARPSQYYIGPIQSNFDKMTPHSESKLGFDYDPSLLGAFDRDDTRNRSMSANDLRRMKPLYSSIKINYEYDTEDEPDHDIELVNIKSRDLFHDKGYGVVVRRTDIVQRTNQFMTQPKFIEKLEKSQRTSSQFCDQESTNCKSSSSQRSSSVNHHECQATQGLQSNSELDSAKTNKENQKVSKSSITSSSSSSGCADNDYFISQSSSSMSSSTTSNEREIFSQRASSSGIICSGNTSDEYEESQKIVLPNEENLKPSGRHVNETTNTITSSSMTKSSSPDGIKKVAIELGGKEFSNRCKKSIDNIDSAKRAYRIKTVDEPETYCYYPAPCIHGVSGQSPMGDCDCGTIELPCDCCCDCYDKATEMAACGCEITADEEESIYGRLPHPKIKSLPRQSKLSETLAKKSLSPLSDFEYTNKSIGNDIKSPNKAGWLERRKYSKIFPRFMFSSNSRLKDKSGKIKSDTSSRNQIIRKSCSTQDLT